MKQSHNAGDILPAGPLRPAGIGLRSDHYKDLMDQTPDIGWIEVHPENYFCGGIHRHYLNKAREYYPLSFHAVGLSLGSDQPVSLDHLKNFKELIDIYEPFQISDHASWSASGNAHLNDLLPLPYTEETLSRLCRNIDQTQEFFGRRILVENPSTYISFQIDEMTEQEFMNEVARRTGCGILLDINNIYVQAHNHGFPARDYISQINPEPVGEIHLAGHIEREFGDQGDTLCIDTHNQPVKDDVWELYSFALKHVGPKPTLIEWDSNLPPLTRLVDEAHRAETLLGEVSFAQSVDGNEGMYQTMPEDNSDKKSESISEHTSDLRANNAAQ